MFVFRCTDKLSINFTSGHMLSWSKDIRDLMTLSCDGYSSRNFISFDKTSILNIYETLKMARELAIQASF